MLEICVQSGKWYQENDPEWSFRLIHECGFEGIDYSMNLLLDCKELLKGIPSKFFDQSTEEMLAYYRPVKEAAQRYGVKILQMHAPMPLYVEGREDIDEYLIQSVDKCCAVCGFLGCPALVVHSALHPDKAAEKEINLQMYRKLIPSAKKYGVKICPENIYDWNKGHILEGPCSDVMEACWYVDTLNEEAGEEIFGFCLDVGHANLLGRNIHKFILGLGKRLTILHIHDNSSEVDEHLIPYTVFTHGIDWNGFLTGLREIGYTGPLSFEISPAINLLPEDAKAEGLKLAGAVGRSFRKRIMEPVSGL